MEKAAGLGFILLLSIILMASGCVSNIGEDIPERTVNTSEYPPIPVHQDGELELSLAPEEIKVKQGEVFNLYLSLNNVGNNSLNVVELEEHFSFNIINASGSDIMYCTLPCVLPPHDGSLVRLGSGESLNVTASSSEWWFDVGEHELSAKYFVIDDWMMKSPHWSGTVRAKNIKLIVE